MTDEPDDIPDDLFHGCASAAWLDQAAEERGWPDSEATRRAGRYYEDALVSGVARPARVDRLLQIPRTDDPRGSPSRTGTSPSEMWYL